MADPWERVALGDAALVNPQEPPLPPDAPFVPMDAVEPGARWVRYFEERGDRNGARAQGGDTLFARITPCLENGKVAQVQADINRCGGSTEFIVLRVGPSLLPGYLYLWATSPATRAVGESLMTGTTGRQRLSATDMRKMSIPVPPLDHQRRIVDLIAAVDVAVESAGHQATAASSTLNAYLAHAVRNAPGRPVRVSELAVLASGASWSASDVVSDPIDDAIPVVGIPNTPPGQRWVQVSSPVLVRGLSNSDRRLDETSLLIIRTNGNRARIGNVYRVPTNAVGSAYSAFQIGLFPKDQRDSEYLYWLLVSPAVQDQISLASSGTTGLGNIAVSWLRNLPLPWPPPEYRHRVSKLAKALDDVRSGAVQVRDRLSPLRTALLSDLLTGDHPIAESYDRLLAGSA